MLQMIKKLKLNFIKYFYPIKIINLKTSFISKSKLGTLSAI